MHAIDFTLFNVLFSLSGKAAWLDWLIVAIAVYVPYIVGAVLIYTAIKAWQKGKRHEAYGYMLAFLSGGIARGITEAIRLFYHHLRPPAVLHIVPLFPEMSYSFPSGHAVFFFGLAMGVFLLQRLIGRVLTC